MRWLPRQARWRRRRLAAVPLLLSPLAIGLFLFAPLSSPLSLLDFQRHFSSRVEVVRRMEAGELWSRSPLHTLVAVPTEYPRSVSSGVGFRDVLVFREDGALHVVFFPSVSFWPDPYVGFMYRSDGHPPELTSRYLHGYGNAWSETLAEYWWRLVRDK